MLFQTKYINILYHGRSSELRDVLIDTSGVIFGIIIVLIVVCIYRTLVGEIKEKKVDC